MICSVKLMNAKQNCMEHGVDVVLIRPSLLTDELSR